MLESRPYWTILCDRCKVDAFKDGDHSAYSDAHSAVEVVRDSGWLITDDGKHYCENCTCWDEDEDNRVPRPQVRNE
jgi:hypothetical protein